MILYFLLCTWFKDDLCIMLHDINGLYHRILLILYVCDTFKYFIPQVFEVEYTSVYDLICSWYEFTYRYEYLNIKYSYLSFKLYKMNIILCCSSLFNILERTLWF